MGLGGLPPRDAGQRSAYVLIPTLAVATGIHDELEADRAVAAFALSNGHRRASGPCHSVPNTLPRRTGAWIAIRARINDPGPDALMWRRDWDLNPG